MISTMYAHIFKEDIVEQGHKLSVVNIGDVSLFFQEDDPRPQMERLRDELDRQIEAIKAERAKPVSAPADPEPVRLDDVVGTPIHEPPYMVPAEVFPQGQEPRCECCDQINGLGGCILKANHEGPHFWEDAPF